MVGFHWQAYFFQWSPGCGMQQQFVGIWPDTFWISWHFRVLAGLWNKFCIQTTRLRFKDNRESVSLSFSLSSSGKQASLVRRSIAFYNFLCIPPLFCFLFQFFRGRLYMLPSLVWLFNFAALTPLLFCYCGFCNLFRPWSHLKLSFVLKKIRYHDGMMKGRCCSPWLTSFLIGRDNGHECRTSQGAWVNLKEHQGNASLLGISGNTFGWQTDAPLGPELEIIELVYDSVGSCSTSVAERLGVFKGAIFCTTCCSAASQQNDWLWPYQEFFVVSIRSQVKSEVYFLSSCGISIYRAANSP